MMQDITQAEWEIIKAYRMKDLPEDTPTPSMILGRLRALVYQTRLYPGCGSGSTEAMAYAALGLAGEAGEFANKIKKILRGDYDSATDPRIYDQLILELGDVLWYVDAIAAELGQPMQWIIRRLVDKLETRHSAGTIKGEGDNR